jgi:subtilisin family serine protease
VVVVRQAVRVGGVFLVVGLALLAGAASIGQTAANGTATVDPHVLADTANGQVGAFIVVLRSRANLAGLATIRDRNARARQVVGALVQAAATSQPPVEQHLRALGSNPRPYWIANAFAVTGNRAVVDAMAARPDVAAIESDRPFTTPLERPSASAPAATAGIEWNVSWIHAPSVWATGFTGQGEVIASADTGVEWDHPALKPHYRGWNGAVATHDYNWWDAIHVQIATTTNPCGYSVPVPCDDLGHGTHTTGIAVGDDGAGDQIGVAPGATWIGCRNMDQGVGRPSTYIECLQFFLAPTDLTGANPDPSKHPDAVNNSYYCPPSETCTTDSLQSAVDAMRAAGIFMAVAAGNDGPGCSTVQYPPTLYASSITVGATDNQSDAIASFSSRGPVTADGSSRTKPDVAAPGVAVRSSYPVDSYAVLSGTSMATPHLAGVVALLWSAFPTLRGDVADTETYVEQSAVREYDTQGCGGDSSSQIPNNVYGHGRIDAWTAYLYTAGAMAAHRSIFPIVPNGAPLVSHS